MIKLFNKWLDETCMSKDLLFVYKQMKLFLFPAKPVINSCLKMLTDWVDCVSGEVVKSKQICYQSMSEIVNITLNIFPVFIHQPGKHA